MFLPVAAEQASGLGALVRARLASSLDYLWNVGKNHVDCGDVGMPDALENIRRNRQRASLYARYFELAMCLRTRDFDRAASMFREIVSLSSSAPVDLEIRPLTRAAMGSDADRYARQFNVEGEAGVLGPPDMALWPAFPVGVRAALGALEIADAGLSAEVGSLVVDVVATAPAAPGRSFSSVSSLTLWGAVVLNMERNATTLDILESIVHESAHLLLFSYAVREPLVTNPSSERYSSPLRSDPRSMDGVLHATFVCARLGYLYRSLLSGGGCGLDVERCVLESRLEYHGARYAAGARIVSEHARFSRTGRDLMDATSGYMANAA